MKIKMTQPMEVLRVVVKVVAEVVEEVMVKRRGRSGGGNGVAEVVLEVCFLLHGRARCDWKDRKDSTIRTWAIVRSTNGHSIQYWS